MEKLNYKKYFSNGDLDKLNEHECMCCKKVKNDITIFVFDSEKHYKSSGNSIFRNTDLNSPIKTYENVYLCANCLYRLSKKIPEEEISKMVAEEI